VRAVALILLAANLGLGGWIAAGMPGWTHRDQGPPPEIGKLALLREEPAHETADRAGSACYTIGPFADAKQAQNAHARLDELGLEPQQRTTTDEEVYGYQVLLPPFPSREAALEATRKLAGKGIKDYFIIVSDPELENAVSLGLFREKRYAVRHTQYLEKLGFEPDMRLRTRERTRYWQDYRDPQRRVTAELLESLAAGQPLQRLERPCG